MGKFNKNWMKQLSESYIWEMQQPPPMIPPGGDPSPQPMPAPGSDPLPIPPMEPTPRPNNMAKGMPTTTPGVSEPGNTLGPTTLGVNGIYYVYEYDRNGNLVRVHYYINRQWVVG